MKIVELRDVVHQPYIVITNNCVMRWNLSGWL